VARYSPRTVLPTECTSRLGDARLPVEYTLRQGETLDQVLNRLGLSGAEAHAATTEAARHFALRSLRAGTPYSAFFSSGSTLSSLSLNVESRDDAGRLELSRDDHWQVRWQPFVRATELRTLHGTLADGSLETAIRRVGGPPGLAYRMAEALQWDLDFARDLRRGDRFQAMYQTVRLDGKDHGVGDLLALVYDNQRRRHEAYRFGDSGGYYDGEGRFLKKMFLRSPLRYTHITSMFSQHRLHPVLGEVRPHYGVDYSAPVGTPVEATANGVVTFAGWDGGGGNVVKLQHGPDYMSAYLHLSRFASGVHPGSHVHQGDVIAFTGATGLATGPHLDYRVKFRGEWIDPLTLKGVRDEPIAPAQLVSFHSWRDTVRSSLDSGIVPASLTLPAVHPAAGGGATRLAKAGAPDGAGAGNGTGAPRAGARARSSASSALAR
jgi:murein DD-endopeptidase MepM/ murein hydrolase activator NlpD